MITSVEQSLARYSARKVIPRLANVGAFLLAAAVSIVWMSAQLFQGDEYALGHRWLYAASIFAACAVCVYIFPRFIECGYALLSFRFNKGMAIGSRGRIIFLHQAFVCKSVDVDTISSVDIEPYRVISGVPERIKITTTNGNTYYMRVDLLDQAGAALLERFANLRAVV